MAAQLEELAFEPLVRRYLSAWVLWTTKRGPAVTELSIRHADAMRRHYLGVWRRWMERGLRAEQLEQRHFVVMLQRWFIRWRFVGGTSARRRGQHAGVPVTSLSAPSFAPPAQRAALPVAPFVDPFASPAARPPPPDSHSPAASERRHQSRPSAVLSGDDETDPWIREHLLSDPRFALH
jgi:hypothetical protein